MVVSTFVGLSVVLSACAGSTGTPELSVASPPEALALTDDDGGASDAGAEGTIPGELEPDPDILLEGDTAAMVTPGETVTIEHLVHNSAAASHSLRFQAVGTDLDVNTSPRSLRLGSKESIQLTTTVRVPDNVTAGDVLSFSLLAVRADDVSQRGTADVRLLVVDVVGERPAVLDVTSETDANEKLTIYLIGAATDADNDLDPTSLRIVAGGFRSADMSAAADGTITYFPFRNLTGPDVVLYELCDHEGRCDTGTLTIDVHN